MLGGKGTSDQDSAAGIAVIAAVYVTLLVGLIMLYLGLHWNQAAGVNTPFFKIDTVAGRAAELAFWSALGVLYAGLGRLAKIMILSPPASFSLRHFVLYGLKRVTAAWIAVLLLGFAAGVVLILMPDISWLAVDDTLALAAGLIPTSFLLGFYGNVANSFFLGLRDGAQKKVAELRKGGGKNGLRKAWHWLQHAFIKSLWLGGPNQ